MSSFMSTPDPAKTELGYPRILSPTAAIRVSPFCLGAMSIGEKWKESMGSLSKPDAFKLLDAFWEAGGNFIDSANNYQDGDSEEWIGEWMAKTKLRDQLVIATKFTTQFRGHELGKGYAASNYQGNSRKSMRLSLENSLKKLQTDYIDLFYLHWWDHTASIPEVMNSLHALVEAGKVLYLGVSDTPAWIVASANEYAINHGKTPFSVYQGKWSVLEREFERDIIPMARHYGMALCPWNVIGGGKLKTKAQIEAREKEEGKDKSTRSLMGSADQSEAQIKMSSTLESIAKELDVESITAVAIAYVMQKAPNVFPLIGGRKVEHLMQNIEALSIHLTDKHIEEIEKVSKFEIGFPHDMIGQDPHYAPTGFMTGVQLPHIKFQRDGKPIGHQ